MEGSGPQNAFETVYTPLTTGQIFMEKDSVILHVAICYQS